MRWHYLAATLAALPAVLAASEQLVLGKGHGKASSVDGSGASADAPAYRKDLVDLHRNLVSIESISGNENEVGNYLLDYLEKRGFTTEAQVVAPNDNTPKGSTRFNVIAWPGKSENPKPKVLVSSHIDVVPPHIEYSIDDGELTKDTMIKGRGTVDAKGSVASMVIAVEELMESGDVQDDDVMLVFVVDEEVGGGGMAAFSDLVARKEEKEPRSWHSAIFGEPTGNDLVCGHKGALFCDISVQGIASHSGYPWLGKSANELMIHAMSKVLAADLGSSELYGNTTVNVGRFDGGVAANVVPEKAVVKMGVRVAIGPEESGHLIVKKKIEDLLAEVDDGFEMKCTPGYGTVDCKCDVDGFEVTTVNYGTDVPNLKGNFTRYLYGPGTILVAHGSSENLTVGDLETAVAGYQTLILNALDS